MIGTTLRHFRIEQKLGAGGMGEVYIAHDLKLDRKVALKFIHPELANDPEARQRFEREARALAALNHPGVGAVYGVEEADGRLFIVLAYIEGHSLESLLAEGALTPARARALLPRIAEGLQAAHRRGIVHRDVKSANIVVGEDDLPKLVDFGIALRGGESRLTQSGVYAGTPGFTAPEVFHGAPGDTRSDVFSLGVVFYEALTGRRPFDRASQAAAMHAVLNEDPAPFPRDLPPESLALEPIVLRCLDKDPARRFADAGEVVEALQALAAGTTVETGRTPRRRAPSRRTWMIAGAAALLVTALAGWFVMRRNAAPRATADDTAGKRTVAVLDFENVTGDSSLNWMKRGTSELLSAALVQSPELDVFDAQRLSDLAVGDHAASPPQAPNVAFLARHGIRRAIAGNILRSGGDLLIQGRIVDTRDGRPVHSYQVEGPADSGLFHIAGRLISDLQVALEVNLTGNREAEGWLREITTTSADAYRLYLRGHQALLATHWKEAAAACEKAVELDSTFVAARTDLAGAYWNLEDTPKLELTRAAMRRLRGRANHRDQLRIDLFEAVVGNDPATLIRSASELAQLYPENIWYTYLLGRGYYTSKQYRRCLDTLRPLIDVRYKWVGTYLLGGRSAARLGDSTFARRIYEQGIELSGANPELAYDYALFLEAAGDRDRIRTVIDQALRSPTLAENPVGEGELRLQFAKSLVTRGDMVHAREELRHASTLIPEGDEARAEADSLLRRFGMR